MKEKTVEEQIQEIRKISKEILKSKESATQFLIEAGIIEADDKAAAEKNSNQIGVSSTISDYRISQL